MTTRRQFVTTATGAAMAAGWPSWSLAQPSPWPSAKPINYIVPFFAGSTSDVMSRILTKKLSESLRQTLTVDNRTGMGGNLGAAYVAKAEPDGYTLLAGTSGTHAVNVSLYKKLPFHPVRDFEPVALVGSAPSILVVGSDLGINSMAELIALLKRDEKRRHFGSAGAGTSPHLAGELFSETIGIPLTHIPYRGQSGLTDIVSGQVTFKFDQLPSTLPLVQAGRLKALAVTSSRRMQQLPDVPTMAEAGVPNFVIESWHAVYAPKGTPKPIVNRLNAEIAKALSAPDVKSKLADLGMIINGGAPADLAGLMAREIPRWAEVVKRAGATLD